ncbi:receptor-like protein 7 [Hibiscus syriacus]|uniref:receptor-like protein 7 n=1 Tax=Hibiscus syriacus TaxID=106335 RepID=UPI001924348C|nr:receptor-like protein 7 [Hibiscus syriacus]
MKALPFLVSIFFLFSCFLSLVFSLDDLPKKCLDDQRSSLLQLQHDLFNAPNFAFSSKFELWDLNADCCFWEGVTCDALGHVIGLDLSHNNISGTFHSIFDLRHLHHLNLAGNNFNTTLLSYGFDKLQNLTHLNLSNSCFHGQIPVKISSLTRLVSLDLSNQGDCYWRYYQFLYPHSGIYSSVPVPYELERPLKLEKPNFKTLIKNLRNLTELYLDGVDFSFQSNKWCKTTSLVLSKLQVLSLSNCGLEGPLCSSLSRLSFLSKLFLGGNLISSLPPNFLEISSRLVSLSLADCSLSGHFPTEILLLPKIQSIDISNNGELMGQLPEFPSNIALRILSLSDTNFSGKLPESIGKLKFLTVLTLSRCNFLGSIPSSIANLSHLVNLDLSHNNLSGSISSSVFTLPSLQVLSLEDNNLDGKIHDFPNASSSLIEELNLGSNHLTGPIPKSIFQLPRLERLFIGDNSFSSMNLSLLFQIKNLRALDLSDISLLIESSNRSINFPQLESLWLSSCNLTEFPGFIKTQDKLFELDLSNNHIHGVVPNWLWKTTLLSLDLSFNPIHFPKQLPLSDANLSFPMLIQLFLGSCNLSAFPEFLSSQENLEALDLSNNGISGAIPKWVWKRSLYDLNLANNHLSSLDQLLSNQNLTSLQASFLRPICDMSRLSFFDASHNNLSGPIPNCLGNMSELLYLDLHGNNFSGILPDFAKSPYLSILKVSENRLEGKLPRSLSECIQLQVLDVGNNMLRDTFPFWLQKLRLLNVLILRENRFHGEMKHFKHKIVFPTLDVLDIASNEISGELPVDYFRASLLRSLKISGNKFEGKLPRSLATCSKLEVLDLGNNMIHDTFPIWLMKLPSLKVLILRENKFHGTIDDFDTGQGFRNLRILDIASNNFSGDLSTEFLQCLKAMMQMSNGNKAELEYIGGHYSGGQYYEDSVTIVNKGVEIFYQKVLTILTCLDLSNNSFHGRIPEDIHILRSLKVLNLSHNSFSGEIPSALDNLKELESLDLSMNNLSGKIPPQLTGLTFLAALNLSYNQLEGSIPQSNQFITFSNGSYIGNPKLCGPPLSRKCKEVGLPMSPPPSGEKEEDSWLDAMSTWQIALTSYASCLVAGICIGFTVLNELGNRWVYKFRKHGKRSKRKFIFQNQP